uniref:WHIM2 domain-containing protein n=2 Tax=Brassica TaxID=3705 RepID=A0A0D3C168_BRAOL
MTRQEAVSMLLLVDVETELQRGSFSTLSISCKFLALLQSVESQILILDMWKDSLNSLTWAEILRQILVAAGFGSVKRAGGQSEELSKERRLMKKYGLRLGTLKGELFRMLNEQGGKNGLKISELANAAVEVAALNLATASEEEGERSICSTLASDITLFEKSREHHPLINNHPRVSWVHGGERIEELSKSSDSHPVDSSSIVGAAFAKLAGDNVHPMQSVYLGSDRRFNRYWLFLGPCNANDPGHRCVYFESSEDGHWEVISHKEALRALLSVLDDRGRREARLIDRRSYLDTLTRCKSCHDLYWRDEKHCKICHATFELDIDLEERYAIHAATCNRKNEESSDSFPDHKVLSSQLQSLKAAVYAIESAMPEDALIGAWKKSAHRLWAKRLRRSSTLSEITQVIGDFVGAINEDWLWHFGEEEEHYSNALMGEIITSFPSMPRTTSAIALWLVKLDTLIASYVVEKAPLPEGNQLNRTRKHK